MQNKEIWQIRAKKKELDQELQQHEGTLAKALNELSELEDHEPLEVPGMFEPQIKASLACLVGAKNIQIEGARQRINGVRMKMAKLTIQENRLRRAQ